MIALVSVWAAGTVGCDAKTPAAPAAGPKRLARFRLVVSERITSKAESPAGQTYVEGPSLSEEFVVAPGQSVVAMGKSPIMLTFKDLVLFDDRAEAAEVGYVGKVEFRSFDGLRADLSEATHLTPRCVFQLGGDDGTPPASGGVQPSDSVSFGQTFYTTSEGVKHRYEARVTLLDIRREQEMIERLKAAKPIIVRAEPKFAKIRLEIIQDIAFGPGPHKRGDILTGPIFQGEVIAAPGRAVIAAGEQPLLLTFDDLAIFEDRAEARSVGFYAIADFDNAGGTYLGAGPIGQEFTGRIVLPLAQPTGLTNPHSVEGPKASESVRAAVQAAADEAFRQWDADGRVLFGTGGSDGITYTYKMRLTLLAVLTKEQAFEEFKTSRPPTELRYTPEFRKTVERRLSEARAAMAADEHATP